MNSHTKITNLKCRRHFMGLFKYRPVPPAGKSAKSTLAQDVIGFTVLIIVGWVGISLARALVGGVEHIAWLDLPVRAISHLIAK